MNAPVAGDLPKGIQKITALPNRGLAELALYARRPQKRQDVSFGTHEGVQNGKIFMRVSLSA